MAPGDWYPLPPPARRISPLRVALASALLVLVLCAGGGLLLAAPVLEDYPATMSAPAHLAGMQRLDDPRLKQESDKLVGSTRGAAGLDSMVAAFYLPAGAGPTKLVLVAGGTRLLLNLTAQAQSAFAGMRQDGADLTGEAGVDPGPMGGAARCATAKVTDVPVPVGVCVWVDYGSFGFVLAFDRTLADTADLMVLIRPEVVHRD
jgi:hypothetical protein